MDRFPLGYNTYSVRAMRWHDLPLLEYAAKLKLDAVYLQDSLDPANNDPAHWKELKEAAARFGLELQGGDAGSLPRTPDVHGGFQEDHRQSDGALPAGHGLQQTHHRAPARARGDLRSEIHGHVRGSSRSPRRGIRTRGTW